MARYVNVRFYPSIIWNNKSYASMSVGEDGVKSLEESERGVVLNGRWVIPWNKIAIGERQIANRKPDSPIGKQGAWTVKTCPACGWVGKKTVNSGMCPNCKKSQVRERNDESFDEKAEAAGAGAAADGGDREPEGDQADVQPGVGEAAKADDDSGGHRDTGDRPAE